MYSMYDPDEFTYKKDGENTFVWRDSPIELTSIVFFVAYDYEEDRGSKGILHKHGTVEQIERYETKNRTKFTGMETYECFQNTRHFSVDVTKLANKDLSDVNRCLTNSGYVGAFLEKHGLVPEQYDEYEIIE